MMIIRNEQVAVFSDAAEEEFVQRLTKHLKENYADAVVRLPEEETPLAELEDDTLHRLVLVSIERARGHGLTKESSISAFSSLMFEAAPNFDEHNLSKLCLEDEQVEPDKRLDEILKIFNEKHWEKIRTDYDTAAWEQKPVQADSGESEEIEDFTSTFKRASKEEKDIGKTLIESDANENPATPRNFIKS